VDSWYANLKEGRSKVMCKHVTVTPQAFNLAELRLHLRDEYMLQESMEDHLRRTGHIIPDPTHSSEPGHINLSN
jgi:hypothetical protein